MIYVDLSIKDIQNPSFIVIKSWGTIFIKINAKNAYIIWLSFIPIKSNCNYNEWLIVWKARAGVNKKDWKMIFCLENIK
jgi:hypothetical protein